MISNLENANVVTLVEVEEEVFDHKDNIIGRRFKNQPDVCFAITNNSHNKLYRNVKKELKNNTLAIGFNKRYYCEETINKCKSIKSKIERIHINGISLCTRTDAVFTQYKIGEVEYAIDSDGNHYEIPKSEIINPVPFEKYSDDVLNKISDYFTYQEKVLNIIIGYMGAELKKNRTELYRKTTYPYKSFMFSDKLIEQRYEYINMFFEELGNKNYIDSNNLKLINDAFHGSRSKSKIFWKSSKTDLWYFVSQMEKRNFIIDTKKIKAELIANVFTLGNGPELTRHDFKHLHKPANTRELDQILGILGPTKKSRN